MLIVKTSKSLQSRLSHTVKKVSDNISKHLDKEHLRLEYTFNKNMKSVDLFDFQQLLSDKIEESKKALREMYV